MINLNKYLKPILKEFKDQEYIQAVAINNKYHNIFVKLFYLEQLAYGKEQIIEKIKDTRVKLMDYFEEHSEVSI